MLTKVHHVGIVVRSAEQALGFYRDTLGLPVTKDEVIADQGVRGVLLAAGQGEIELLEPTRPDTGVARFLDSRGEGMHHLCFATDNIEAELETARERGLSLIDQQPRPGLAGMIAFVHPRSTGGVLVEYAQPPHEGEANARQPSGGIGIRELDHVVVAVRDLDARVQMYRQNFALQEERRVPLPQFGAHAALLQTLGPSYIELLTPTDNAGPLATFLQERGEGLYRLSLAVADLDRARQSFAVQGIEPDSPREVLGHRMWSLPLRATHGVSLQLIERGA